MRCDANYHDIDLSPANLLKKKKTSPKNNSPKLTTKTRLYCRHGNLNNPGFQLRWAIYSWVKYWPLTCVFLFLFHPHSSHVSMVFLLLSSSLLLGLGQTRFSSDVCFFSFISHSKSLSLYYVSEWTAGWKMRSKHFTSVPGRNFDIIVEGESL